MRVAVWLIAIFSSALHCQSIQSVKNIQNFPSPSFKIHDYEAPSEIEAGQNHFFYNYIYTSVTLGYINDELRIGVKGSKNFTLERDMIESVNSYYYLINRTTALQLNINGKRTDIILEDDYYNEQKGFKSQINLNCISGRIALYLKFLTPIRFSFYSSYQIGHKYIMGDKVLRLSFAVDKYLSFSNALPKLILAVFDQMYTKAGIYYESPENVAIRLTEDEWEKIWKKIEADKKKDEMVSETIVAPIGETSYKYGFEGIFQLSKKISRNGSNLSLGSHFSWETYDMCTKATVNTTASKTTTRTIGNRTQTTTTQDYRTMEYEDKRNEYTEMSKVTLFLGYEQFFPVFSSSISLIGGLYLYKKELFNESYSGNAFIISGLLTVPLYAFYKEK